MVKHLKARGRSSVKNPNIIYRVIRGFQDLSSFRLAFISIAITIVLSSLNVNQTNYMHLSNPILDGDRLLAAPTLNAHTTTTTTTTSIPLSQPQQSQSQPPQQQQSPQSPPQQSQQSPPQQERNYPWPGSPKEEIGHALVQKGRVEFATAQGARRLLLENLQDFLEIYRGRPDKVNLCGMRINHSLALFLAIRALKPTAIIESGVNAGHSTYVMRQAGGPRVKIYSIDPLERPICYQRERWVDATNNVQLTGRNFVDFVDVDWGARFRSGELRPDATLVLLDDHLDPSTRYPTILKYGFRHVLFEDNYKATKGATPGDRAGYLPKQMFHRIDSDAAFFWSVTARYAEFPPLVPPVMAKDSTEPPKKAGGFLHATDDLTAIVAPILRPDLNEEDDRLYKDICHHLGVDPTLRDQDSYMQVMNYNQFAYMEFVPLAPQLLAQWK